MELKYVVEDNKYDNLREVLKAYFNISDRLLLRLKKSDKILFNDKVTYLDKKLSIGDVIIVNLDFDEDDSNIVPTKMDLEIIYEDDSYIVINKRPNTPVHPSMLHFEDSLSNGIKYYFNSIGLKRKIRPVNRLDKDTSGIVIFAKNEYIQNCLVHQMKTKEFNKEYLAISVGNFNEKKGTINLPIARKNGSIIERCIDENGDKSITHYEIIKEIDNKLSVVKCILETGRTHQIRVHLASINHPILGDTLYGDNEINKMYNISRQLLHAKRISFIHPITKQAVSYEAKIPEDIKYFINED